MIYAYSENFVLVFSHDEVVHGKGSLVNKMPGSTLEDKFANLRAAYGFMLGHPGKKLLFMGQDFGQMDEWNENAGIEWELLQYPIHSQMHEYVKELNSLYRSHPALYRNDYHPDGFEWINCMDAANNIVSFVRKGGGETLLFICNFAPVLHQKYQVGVPFEGKYKEIFCSDAERFGGSGKVNPRVKTARASECDGKNCSITVQVPPLGVCIFNCTPDLTAAGKSGSGRMTGKGRPKKTAGGKGKSSKASVVSVKTEDSLKTEPVSEKKEDIKEETVSGTTERESIASKIIRLPGVTGKVRLGKKKEEK